GSDRTGELVMGLIFAKPRRAEYGHAWANKVQGSESLHNFHEDLRGALELEFARLWPPEKSIFRSRKWPFAPVGQCLCWLGGQFFGTLIHLAGRFQGNASSISTLFAHDPLSVSAGEFSLRKFAQ